MEYYINNIISSLQENPLVDYNSSMNFVSKKLHRIGKQAIIFNVVFKPLSITLNVSTGCSIHLQYKRGPQQEETSKY